MLNVNGLILVGQSQDFFIERVTLVLRVHVVRDNERGAKLLVNIVTKKTLRDFWQIHPEAEAVLMIWYKVTKKAAWKNLAETKADFHHADIVGICTIFNIVGNKYRLITKIYYPGKKVSIRFVLTHAEYNKKGYKDDCEC